MKLRERIDALKKPFGKGQKWERFAPAVSGLNSIHAVGYYWRRR